MNTRDDLQKRAFYFTEVKRVLETAKAENRGLSSDELMYYRTAKNQFDELSLILGDPELTFENLSIDQIEKRLKEPLGLPAERPDPENRNSPGEKNQEEKRAAFNRYLRNGMMALSGEEQRALQADSDVKGGYLVTPQVVANRIIMGINDSVFIRPLATKFAVRAESLGAPSLDTDLDDADWTTELATGSEDDMDLGKRELRPHPIAKRIKVSNKLLRAAELNPEDLVIQRLNYKFSITEEKAFLTGSGNARPLGVFTASNNGISTARDVSDGNSQTAVTGDGLINAMMSLKEGYQKNAVWVFHRDVVKQIRKLKDGNGDYLWQKGIAGLAPNTILERPYYISEYAPNTFTTGLYVGIVGDFSYYWIVDALDMQIQRLVELYAETNQTGFIGRLECDGAPVLGEAFARVKLA